MFYIHQQHDCGFFFYLIETKIGILSKLLVRNKNIHKGKNCYSHEIETLVNIRNMMQGKNKNKLLGKLYARKF